MARYTNSWEKSCQLWAWLGFQECGHSKCLVDWDPSFPSFVHLGMPFGGRILLILLGIFPVKCGYLGTQIIYFIMHDFSPWRCWSCVRLFCSEVRPPDSLEGDVVHVHSPWVTYVYFTVASGWHGCSPLEIGGSWVHKGIFDEMPWLVLFVFRCFVSKTIFNFNPINYFSSHDMNQCVSDMLQ